MREKSVLPSSHEHNAQHTESDTTQTAATSADDPVRKNLLSEHKGKLAIGVAATLGLMIYYNWRQKRLPEEDPEAYARLQRFRDSVKSQAEARRPRKEEASVPAAQDAQSMTP